MDLLTRPRASQPRNKPLARVWLMIAGVLAAAIAPGIFIVVLQKAALLSSAEEVMTWEASLFILYVVANVLIGLSSVIVALTLLGLGGKERKNMVTLFPFIALGIFSLSNAGAHLFLALGQWKEPYWLALSIQYVSGIAAMGIAVCVPPLIPAILRLFKSAHTSDAHKSLVDSTHAELMKANEALRNEIMERRRAEDKERTNLQRVRGIIDSLPVGAIAFDESDRVLHANTLFCQLFELQTEASALIGAEGNTLAEIIEGQIRNREEHAAQLQELSHSKKTVLGTEIVFKDGRILAQDFIPLVDEGVHAGQVLLYRDITKEKRIDATKSEFMSLASHQLRTPLTTMRWSFGRLSRSLKGRINVSEERLLLEAKGAAGRMASTIDTMLAISRVEAGKVSLEVSEIKLGNTINEVRTECREEYERKQQGFTIDCPPNIHVRTDQYVFKEILRNLFTNAIKYTPPEGKIAVRVAMLSQHVQIDISDSGYGIPAHQQEKIFSKFFRGDNIVQRDTEGTGLGLYLVFLLVKLLGATVFFVSEEGKGTTFTLLLPLQAPAMR